MGHEWDALTYDRVALPQTRWGGQVLDRLELAGDEAVLDAGCGTGRVTEMLLSRLPRAGWSRSTPRLRCSTRRAAGSAATAAG